MHPIVVKEKEEEKKVPRSFFFGFWYTKETCFSVLTLPNDAGDELVFLIALDADALPPVAEVSTVPVGYVPWVIFASVMAPGEVVVAAALGHIYLQVEGGKGGGV